MITKWKKLGVKNIFKNGIVNIINKEFYYDDVADSMLFTVVGMNNWATILPMTADGSFIIVRQFRAGPEADTLEFPGGGINTGETPIEAARRELMEETGAVAEEFIHLGTMDPNPAFMDNKCHVFLAKNAKIIKKPQLDKFEDTEPLVIPEKEFFSMIKNGEFRQSISIAALGLYLTQTRG